ncbi:phage major capsid protein [Bacillus subtilis]|uniref:phage major capsid protein n=1 Tax=Bacillus subtilis TaxID=1423 RepID=UPI001C706EAC|nr:phage major capsid protein [Bacillus subtilis]MBW9317279.1 phage major capsid protein [Bacillus subtilis]MDI6591070.1 phage major capsid protein [Bacillus subtilis]
MNLKALKEKRNALLDEADELLKNAEKEVRSLSADEKSKFDELTANVTDLNNQISELESRQKDGEKNEKTMEERKVDNKEKELRGIEQYLRRQDGEEVRALQTTSQGGAVIPENVEGTIVLKMEETSPVFARATKFPSVAGTLKIAKESLNSVAGFVGEGEDVSELQISFDEVKLAQKRVGAAISLSNQLINDAAVNIVDYSLNLLGRRVGKAVEKSILVGGGGEEFSGIVNDAEVQKIPVSSAVTIDNLMDLYNSIHPEFLASSSFIMQRGFFNQIAKMKDSMGHYYMQNGVVNGKLTYTLFGAEVIVTDQLPDGTPAIFGSVQDAYAVLVKKGFALQHVTGDTTQAIRGSQLLVLDGYMDGAVYNPQAISVLKVDTATTSA